MRPSRVLEELGVGRTTLWDWRQLPAFEARFNEELEEAHEALRSRIRSVQLKALDVVEEVLDSAEAMTHRRMRFGAIMVTRWFIERRNVICYAKTEDGGRLRAPLTIRKTRARRRPRKPASE
jgi:hypothetical protein